MLLTEYFNGIKAVVDNCKIISLKKLELDSRTDFTGVIRGSLIFVDNTVLHFREVVDVEFGIVKVKYGYQYQNRLTDIRIFRYDNAKHHPEVKTFPHHKHLGRETTPDKVVEAEEISLKDILLEIERLIVIKGR